MGLPDSQLPPHFTTRPSDQGTTDEAATQPPDYSATDTTFSPSRPDAECRFAVGTSSAPDSPPAYRHSTDSVGDNHNNNNRVRPDPSVDEIVQPMILVLAGQIIYNRGTAVTTQHSLPPRTPASSFTLPDGVGIGLPPPLYRISRGVTNLSHTDTVVHLERVEYLSSAAPSNTTTTTGTTTTTRGTARDIYELSKRQNIFGKGGKGDVYVRGVASGWGISLRGNGSGGGGPERGDDGAGVSGSGSSSRSAKSRHWAGTKDWAFEMKPASSRRTLGFSVRMWARSSGVVGKLATRAAAGGGGGGLSGGTLVLKGTKVGKYEEEQGGRRGGDGSGDPGLFEVVRLQDRMEYLVRNSLLRSDCTTPAEEEDPADNNVSASAGEEDRRRGMTAVAFEDTEEGSKDTDKKQQHRLVVTAPVPRKVLDAMVALWCMRLWFESAERIEADLSVADRMKRAFRGADQAGMNFSSFSLSTG